MDKREVGYVRKIRGVAVPAIYKHFKGQYYAAMGVSERKYFEIVEDYEVNDIRIECIYARHTETDKNIKIWKAGDKYFHDKEIYEDDRLVLYKSLYDDTGIYARPVDMFLSEVDKEKYPNATQKYRFQTDLNG